MNSNPWVIEQNGQYWAGGDKWGSLTKALTFTSNAAAKHAWREKTNTPFGRHLTALQLAEQSKRKPKTQPEPEPIEEVEAELVDEPGTALEPSTRPFVDAEAVELGMPHPGMPDSELNLDSKTPEELAAIANREHMEYEKTAYHALRHAWYAGKALLAVKTQLSHGEWLPWLEHNFAPSQQTAHLYMTVAANYQRVSNFPDLSLRAAVRSIQEAKRAERQADPNYQPPPPRKKQEKPTGNAEPAGWTDPHLDKDAWVLECFSDGRAILRTRDGVFRLKDGQLVDHANKPATLPQDMVTGLTTTLTAILGAIS